MPKLIKRARHFDRKVPLVILVFAILGFAAGVYARGAFSESKSISATVTTGGSQGLVLSNSSLSFGSMTALQTSYRNFTLSNVGCCLLNLTYSISPGTLPGGSVLQLVAQPHGANSTYALPTYIAAGQMIGYTFILKLGQMAIFGQTYSFNVTITGSTR